jgi:hypothetical protein
MFMIKKYLWLGLLAISLFLVSCTGDLPPEPGAPGESSGGALAGQASAAEYGELYAEPLTFQVTADTLELGQTIGLKISNEDYIWRTYYTSKGDQGWIAGTLDCPDPVADSNWCRTSAKKTIGGTLDNFIEGENFAVIYACKKGLTWNCHNNQWMLHSLQFSVPELLPPEPVAPGSLDETAETPAENEPTEIVEVISTFNQVPSGNANLYVFTQNSISPSTILDSNLVMVKITDSDILDIDQPKGEPDVTVNGNTLRMVQAIDGSWYGYFADMKNAQIADFNGVRNFGTFCGSGSTILFGENLIEVGDTAGIAISSEEGIEGKNPAGSIPDCTGFFSSDNSLNVITDAKPINTEISAAGQIGMNRYAWPFIQLYNLGTSVTVQYNKGGGTQSLQLTTDFT